MRGREPVSSCRHFRRTTPVGLSSGKYIRPHRNVRIWRRLVALPKEDKQACIDAYRFFQSMQDGEETETADETKAVAAYYKVLNNMLSIFDIEKLYIPPQLDDSKDL
jgi:hypothetical protein